VDAQHRYGGLEADASRTEVWRSAGHRRFVWDCELSYGADKRDYLVDSLAGSPGEVRNKIPHMGAWF
jgi:hypothetical protein